MTLRLSVRKERTVRSFSAGRLTRHRWVNYGSSYLPSDMNAAYLWAQLECIDAITAKRLALWRQYDELLQPLQERGLLALPHVPEGCVHNGHMYYIKAKDLAERTRLIDFLRENGIWPVFHYVPLHSAYPQGLNLADFWGRCIYDQRERTAAAPADVLFAHACRGGVYRRKVKEFYHV